MNTCWKNCLKKIKFASDKFKVEVTWVPGHRGIVGNRRGDLLAYERIDRSDIEKIVTKWRESEKMRHSKRHINGYDKQVK